MGDSRPIVLSAMSYAQGGRPGLDGARALARAAIAVLAEKSDSIVCVDVRDLRGVSSSFYNLFFQLVFDELGAEVVRERVRFETAAPVQDSIIARSRCAVIGEEAA